MNDKVVYIIGSLSNFKLIEDIATQLSFFTGYSIKYVKPEPSRSREALIKECFDQIEKSYIVLAVSKKNGIMGEGTLYEIAYARRFGILVLETDGTDLRGLVWVLSHL